MQSDRFFESTRGKIIAALRGSHATAFELADNPVYAGDLGDRPDVLLWCEDPTFVLAAEEGGHKMKAARMQATPAGVWLQDALFTTPPREAHKALTAACWYAEAALRGTTAAGDDAFWNFDGDGAAVPAEDIVFVDVGVRPL